MKKSGGGVNQQLSNQWFVYCLGVCFHWDFIIVCVYPPTRGDWLLGFLYRSSAAQLCVAGLQPVDIQDRRIINVDLSSVVSHTLYLN